MGLEQSAEIVAWGERWLRAWEQEAIDASDRDNRAWVADNWRRANLDTVMQWWQQERREFRGKERDTFNAGFAAENHLLLYLRERNGLLVWRAFAEYRAAGVAVPELILAKFDQWAYRLEIASGATEVAQAIEMAPKGGGPFSAKHLRDVERRRAIASDVERLRAHPNYRASLTKIYARIAQERRTTAGNVKRIHTEWMRPGRERERAKSAASLDDAVKAMAQHRR